METAQTENNATGGLSDLTAGLEASDEQRPTPLEIADWLLSLAEEMDAISIVMDYYGGFAEWAKHGREIAGAGAIARQWADEIVASNVTDNAAQR